MIGDGGKRAKPLLPRSRGRGSSRVERPAPKPPTHGPVLPRFRLSCYVPFVNVDAVIVAAGSSTRFGSEDKLFADLCGKPVLAWSLTAYEAAPSIASIVVVAAGANAERIRALAAAWAPSKFAGVAPGGARRRDSVEAGLRICRTRYVAIHDGARPLTTSEIIERCIAAAGGGAAGESRAGAITAVPVTDTVKEAAARTVTGHPDRARLWAAQTPQVVLRQAWLDAAAMSDNDETDDAAMLSRLGLECAIVEGSPDNLKITRPFDLEVARLIIQGRRDSGDLP